MLRFHYEDADPKPLQHSPDLSPNKLFGQSFMAREPMRIQSFMAVTCVLAPFLASADTVETYAELTGKTVLAPSTLPALPESTDSELPANRTNLIASLEKEISKKGISVVQDGPCFVRLLPSGERQPDPSIIPLRGAQLHALTGEKKIGAGAVNWTRVDPEQVLEIYAGLKGRTILRSLALPAPTIRLKNQCPLTQAELVYAVETVLALNGLCTVDDGRAFVQIVPIPLRSMIDTHAPAADPDAKLFDPKKVPAMGYSNPRPQTKLEHNLERWQKAFLNFMHLNAKSNSSAQQLLELYASLTDKKAEPSKEYETRPIWFHVSTALTRSELLYAIETTFALNNLKIASFGENKVRLGPKMGTEKGSPTKTVTNLSGVSLFAAAAVLTNLVVTPSEVDSKSVRLTADKTPQPNLTFNYLNKTPEQIRAMYRRHLPVWVAKDGKVLAKAIGCTGYKAGKGPDGQLVFSGLVLIFDDLEQARIAEGVLKGENKEPR